MFSLKWSIFKTEEIETIIYSISSCFPYYFLFQNSGNDHIIFFLKVIILSDHFLSVIQNLFLLSDVMPCAIILEAEMLYCCFLSVAYAGWVFLSVTMPGVVMLNVVVLTIAFWVFLRLSCQAKHRYVEGHHAGYLSLSVVMPNVFMLSAVELFSSLHIGKKWKCFV